MEITKITLLQFQQDLNVSRNTAIRYLEDLVSANILVKHKIGRENLAAYLEEGFSEDKLGAELRNENSRFYFALQKEDVIGYLKLNWADAQSENQDPHALEIERIYVLQQYHGTQVGALLYEQALAIAQARKAPYTWLGVWEENPRAIRFYQKQGFVEFGEHIFQ